MELSIHHLNPLATTTIRADTNAIWVGLNSDTSLIPDSAIIFRNLPDPGWSVDDFSDSGQLLPFDDARDPDWYRFEEQWAPWTPTSFLLQQRPWYDLLETTVPVEERDGGWSMAETQRQQCSLDLTQVQECIRYVVDFNERASRRITVPGIFPRHHLANVYPNQKLVQINAAKAKRSVLHSIGWLAWWTTIIVNWENELTDSVVHLISSLLSTVKSKRGVICDLDRDWQTINIPLYLQNNIPFFYLWDFEARSDERFSRLNPGLNLTYWAIRQGTQLSLIPDLEESDIDKIARQATKLDHFFQEIFSYQGTDEPPILHTHSVFVIDFKGWKRRPVERDEATLASLVKFYHYKVLDKEEDSRYKTVIIWRWRKREPCDEYLRRQYKASLPGEDPSSLIRERYRFDYAPKPGIMYDRETGLIASRQAFRSQGISLLERLGGGQSLKERLSGDARSNGSAPETYSNSTDEDLTFVAFPEIPEILYHPRAVNSPAAWIRYNTKKLDQARRRTMALRAARGDDPSPYRRSQSPTRLSDPFFASHDRPEVMFRRMLKDESAKITYTASTWFAPSFAWNSDFLEAAYIFVPDIESEARLRYWANCWDTIGTTQRLLSTAIEHGLKFYLALPQDRLRQFRPIIVDNLDRTSASSLYATGFQEPNLSPAENAAAFCTSYMARMNDLLRRPHARAFIGEGGQFSWIARRWTGLRLVEEFMSGPSIQVTVHNRGFYDSASEDASYLSHDAVSEQEKDLLLGFCPGTNGCIGRWLFPPADIFDDNFELWTGEWNAALDHIYRRLADDIARGKGKLRTREKWKNWIRNNERGQRRPEYLPSTKDFTDVMEGISRAGLQPTWHKKRLDDITFPEQRLE